MTVAAKQHDKVASATINGHMKLTLSKTNLVVSCFVALLTVAATGMWLYFVFGDIRDPSARMNAGIAVMALFAFAAPVLGGLVGLCMIVSGISFFRWRRRMDLWSLCLSASSLIAIVVPVALAYYN